MRDVDDHDYFLYSYWIKVLHFAAHFLFSLWCTVVIEALSVAWLLFVASSGGLAPTVFIPSGARFTSLWAHNSNIVKLLLTNYVLIQCRSQFCVGPDSWAVVPCAKLWPNQIIILKQYSFLQLLLWAHKPLWQWTPRFETTGSFYKEFMGS